MVVTKLTKIFGGPGCGKTTYLLGILDDLLKKTPANRIAYVSFTNKGTDAGVNRARDKHHLTKKDTPYWDTIHAIANREACRGFGTIINKDNYKTFSIATGKRFLGHISEELNHGDDLYLFMENLSRINEKKHARNLPVVQDINTYEWVVNNYRQFKKIYKIYDFTDMLEMYIKKGKPLDIDHLIIDEAQDLTPLQWKVVEIMSANCAHVFIAGDDDQAIYEWCGGDVEIFNQMAADDTWILDRSYRLGNDIISMSHNIISNIKDRQKKNIRPVHEHMIKGDINVHFSLDSVPIRKGYSYYLLSRNRCFLRKHRIRMYEHDLPFVYIGKHYPREVSRSTKAEMSMVEYNYCIRMLDNRYKRNLEENSRITVDTIHRVKGGEADIVVLLTDCTKAVENNWLTSRDEEIRILYTALTRAKSEVHIVTSGSKMFTQIAEFSRNLYQSS